MIQLAYTKIIALRASLTKAVKYVLNEEKTDLANAVNYAMNPDKNEHHIFESSFACDIDTAYEEMLETKNQFSNTGGIVGYHIIQSFAPNEVTPQQAFDVAEEFVRRYLADKYQVVWSTHLDKNHYHNHIVFNSVSYKDGRKYRSTAKSYYDEIRAISDKVCKDFNLSVITPDINNKSLTYIEWLGLNKGKTTWQSIIRGDIDAAIKNSLSFGEFLIYMEHIGYQIKQGKYIAFRPYGKERFSRGYKLGDNYSEDAIRAQIDNNKIGYIPANSALLTKAQKPAYKKRYMTDLERGYWRWMYQMNMVKEHKAPPRMSKYFKEELLKFEQYKEQQTFINTHDFSTKSEFYSYMKATEDTIAKLKSNLKDFNNTLYTNKKLYTALTHRAQFEKAYQLYNNGYHMMEDEANKYKQAVKLLSDLGFTTPESINSIEAKKANVYEQISSVKKDIRYYQKEVRTCKNIERSMKNMEQKQAMIDTRKQYKTKRKKR